MMCMFDIFKNCLILRHRRSHDITVPSSTKGSFGLTRSSSTTSIISCTKKQDDLPPLGTLPRNPQTNRPVSLISSRLPNPPSLPARPNSIVGLPSIPEAGNNKEAQQQQQQGVTIIADYSEPADANPIEPEYSEPLHSLDSAVSGADSNDQNDAEDYPYQDIYEEIKHQREDDLPDVVTSAYASGEQVYQELLDLVKEEEIKEEKRRSQLFLNEHHHKEGSLGSIDSSDPGSSFDDPTEQRDFLNDLYAVPKRTKTEGPRLPPRRVKSSYNRDPDWAPKVPEKSSLLRRTLSDAGKNEQEAPAVEHDYVTVNNQINDNINSNDQVLYEELNVRKDRLI